MPSFSLIAVEGGTGYGSHTLPVYQPTAQPNLGGRSQGTAGQEDVYTWNNVTWPAPSYSSISPSYKKITEDVIQGGWYWMGSENSGYQIYVEADEYALQFGPIKIRGTTFGDGSSVGGSGTDINRCYGIGCKSNQYGDVYYMWFGSTDTIGEGGVKTYGIDYAFTSTNISDVVTGDSPYNPPSGQAGSDSAAGGGGTGGAGYPTGINTDTPNNKKNRAGAGCDIYLCSPIAVKAFTKMLWGSTNTGFIDAFFKRVQNAVYNPVDSIITCHSLPSAFAPTGGTQSTGIKAGGVDFSTYDGACVGQIVANEWVHSGPYVYSCEECWGNYSDYRDTKVSLYLPFCGIVPLDTSLFLSYKGELRVGITIDYWCNILNGNCAAFIKTQDRFGDTKLIKVATGNCAQPCPISGNDRGMQQKLGSLFGFGQSVLNVASGGSPIQIMAGVASGALGVEQAFFTASHHTDVVGSLNGAAGFAAATDIQIMFDIPIPINSDNYSLCRGRPSEVSRSVGEYSGHCELELHADSVNYATDEEKREIERICLNGILI